jgi:hypothetical protein
MMTQSLVKARYHVLGDLASISLRLRHQQAHVFRYQPSASSEMYHQASSSRVQICPLHALCFHTMMEVSPFERDTFATTFHHERYYRR